MIFVFSDRQNWSLLYRCLLTKLELKIGRERVQLAEKMCEISTKIEPINAAERRFKKEGKCHLALVNSFLWSFPGKFYDFFRRN